MARRIHESPARAVLTHGRAGSRHPAPLDVLRSMLLHPSMGFDARDAALTWLVQRAQREGGAWLVGLAGVLLPGIGRRVSPLGWAFPRHGLN